MSTERICRRTACRATQTRHWHWNQSTRDWYCEICAEQINCAETGGTPYLCIPEYNLPTKADLE